MACIKTEEPQWEAGSAPNGTPNKPGQKNIIQIYTDWANHYLDKGKCKRHIQNLQNDVVDGVIISDVIEAVTGQKVADVNRKPKTRAQMLQNLDLCLAHLRALGVAVDDIQGDDVIDGKLKPILGLFFQLSRHKQQQQQQQKRRPRTDAAAPANHASTKVPTTGKSGVSCIPSARERQPGDNRTKQSLLQKPASAASSRSGSPTSVSGSRQRLAGQRSGISTPRMGRAATAKAAAAQTGSAIKTPQTKPSNIGSPATATSRERNKAKSGGSNVIKRTSSSSGFSSARSERSDSSSNVNTNESLSPGEPTATPAPVRAIPEGYGSLSRRGQRSMLQAPGQRSRPGIVPPAAAAAKRRSLAGSQSSLASSCSSAAPSSIPKPPSASVGAHQSSSSSSVPTASSSSSPRSSTSVSAPAVPATTSIPTPAAAAAPPATPASPAPPTSAPALRRPSESEDSRSGAEEKAALVQLPKQRQLGRGRVNPGGVSVALVSPMPHTPEMGRASSKTRTASGDRSRPKEAVSDPPPEQKPPSPPDKPPPDADGEADQEDVYSLRPMQPILRLSQYGYSRGTSLAQRRQQAQQHQHNYGYMSDTDAVADQNPYDTVMDGYMSEDGLYARSPPQVKYSSGGEETALRRIETQQRGIPTPAMSSDRAAYYSYTDAPGANFMKRIGHSGEQTRIGKKDGAPEFKQISNTQWKRAVEGRRPPGDLTSGGVPSPGGVPDQRRERERSATPVNKHKRENGTNTPDPAMSSPSGAAAESPNLKFSRSKLRKSAASYAKSTSSTRPTSQTSVSSAGSSGLPPKDPEHRPRTKVKVSGSTQTTSELLGGEQEHHAARRLQQLKSYSLTGPAAQQLSQSVRERILAGGGAGNGSEHTFSTLPAVAGRERVPRPKPSDGSLSDSNYGTYADPRRHPAQRPSSAYTSYVGQQLAKTFRGSMTEAESMESVSSGASGLLQQLQQQQQQQQQRSGSLTHNRLINYQWEGQAQSPRLSRSNSIRSTKSEKLYSNMLQRGGSGEEEPFYGGGVPPSGRPGEPPSPTPSPSRASFPLSPSTARSSYGARSSRDDDAHGSSLSLVSTTSSLYSAHEEKQATEARRLKRELLESQEKVQTLTNQLTTNAHVVEAFEQSLTSMTKKLHQVTLNSEQKERELGDLRRQMDRLQRAIAAGSGVTPQGGGAPLTRQTSNESISSLSSACSAHSQQSGRTPDSPGSKKKKKKGWFSASPQLRSSFGKAFSRRKPKATAGGSDMEDGSAPSSPVMPSRHSGPPSDEPAPESAAGGVEADLRRQLREKDTALTDMRLEALSTHHQLETLKETVGRMRREMACVRQDNERLQRLVASRSAGSSRSSLAADGERPPAVPSPTSETAASRLEEARKDEKLLTASVWLDGAAGEEGSECLIGTVTVGRKTIWESLDDAIKRTFKDYLCRLDPDQSLGIDADAITGYTLGEVTRPLSGGADVPELMPWGYTVGDVKQTRLSLRGTEAGCVDAFVFETLIPKPMVHRYVSILVEHRRVILCGQSGTGKTYLARRLADYLVRRSGMSAGPDSVATVTVEPGGGRELHQYLAQLSERCRQPDAALPHVLILDQLHHVQALDDVFNGFLSTAHTDPRCPYIIGTMSQPAGGTTSLQLHHNFRWVLCANHVEPVRGFLGRHLRRRLSSAELASGSHDPQLRAVFEWVPRVWQQLNKFLETHSSADVTMGPRLLLNCPTDLTASQVWFTGVWNYSIVPYLVETVREGLLIYGRRASWHDPTQFVVDTYPWPRAAPHAGVASLTRLRPEDVGYESASANYKDAPASAAAVAEKRSYGKDSDPLLSMLMSLQEAANYNSAVPVSARSSSAAASPDRTEPGRPGRGVSASGQATL